MTSPLDPRTRIGQVSLTVADLGRSVDFYTARLGLDLLERGGGEARLGSGQTPCSTWWKTAKPGRAAG